MSEASDGGRGGSALRKTRSFAIAKGTNNAEGCEATKVARASITAISTKQKSDEHLLLLHRRLRRESGHLTKQKEPRLEIALVFLLFKGIEIINYYVI